MIVNSSEQYSHHIQQKLIYELEQENKQLKHDLKNEQAANKMLSYKLEKLKQEDAK